MPTSYKVLGQVATAETTDTDIYTVPSATQAIISTIVVANRGADFTNFRIAVRPAGEALTDKHYIAYNVDIGPNDSTNLTLGVTMNATDVLTAYAGNADISFSVFGSEVS